MADDSNFYPETDAAAPSEAESDNSGNPEMQEDQDDQAQGETTLIPKSMLGDRECQPGEKLDFEVVHVYDGEVEVKFTGYNEEGEREGAMENSLSEMSEYAKPGSE